MLSGIKDVDMIILNKLEDVELVKTCQVNRKADEICKDQNFWFSRVKIKFPKVGINILNKYKGNRSWSEYYIQDLRKINQTNAQEYLNSGSRSGRLDHVMIAIGLAADLHFENEDPLITASYNRHLEVVKYLIEQGADIHAHDDYPLINASANGHLDVVKFLVEQGADIHAQNDRALRLASEFGYLEVVNYLVEQMRK